MGLRGIDAFCEVIYQSRYSKQNFYEKSNMPGRRIIKPLILLVEG